MKSKIFNFLEKNQIVLLVIGDIILLLLAFAIGSFLIKSWYREDIPNLILSNWTTYVGICVFILLFWIFRLYKYTWRYAGIEVATSVIASCSLGIIVTAILRMLCNLDPLRLALFFIYILIIAFISLFRLCARSISKKKNNAVMKIPQNAIKNLLIVGSFDECGLLVKSFKSNEELLNYNICGVVGYSDLYTGKYVGTIKVLGCVDNLLKYVESQKANEVLFILDDEYDGERVKKSIFELRHNKIPVKTIGKFSERVAGKKRVTLKDINVEDLLHRPSRKTDLSQFGDYITEKTVMVTGGGGSIGSEIVRQVAALKPKQLIILGHGENSVFKINADIREAYPDLNIYPVIASIADRERMFNVFEQFKPQVVFHAAAHKHVPLMELNIHEAVRNNICGTKNLADACYEYKVNAMVQISTDKAADPSSVMGATKFVCEQIVKSEAKRQGNKTKFVIVRFGNVLGSRGSVIPVFLKQIENGGPVTVTDPEMTRFFMIIPEACRLVIQAGSIGENGNIYVLDMGKPVKIMDLAEDIISICGYVPGKDMEIKISGIRPGEKLHETLSSETETLKPTDYKGINTVASSEVVDYNYLSEFITKLNSLEKTKDATTFIKEVNTLKK